MESDTDGNGRPDQMHGLSAQRPTLPPRVFQENEKSGRTRTYG